MRTRLNIFLSLILLWMTFFSVARILFLIYNYTHSSQLTLLEISKAMLYGLRMDMSTTGYMAALTGLVLTIGIWLPGRWISVTLHTITISFLVLFSLILTVDLELYRHWGFRMNITPFFYMGSEATGMAGFLTTLKLLLILVLIVWVFTNIYFKKVAPPYKHLQKGTMVNMISMLCITGLLFFPIRGSLSTATMNVGVVYFHKTKMFANHAGINVIWNFLYSLKNDNAIKYPEDILNKETTDYHIAQLYPKQDSTLHVLKTNRPNIILIILESFTADVIEPLGGKPGAAPNLSRLCKEGILFDQFFANGDRTDKGLVSILSAFPAQPKGSIIKYPQKTQRLSYLSVKLDELGYKNSFVYGGDANFANYRSFLTTARFWHITSADDFPDELNVSKWGVHDEYVFQQAMRELDTTRNKPFFQTILTLSSHEPFDVPMKPVFTRNDDEALFLNSCYYTDQWLGKFIDEARTKPWWDNTLLIITADHGHRLPGNKRYETRGKFKIPMLWIGGAVSRDTVIHTYGNQTDIANTVLAQLDQPSSDFVFSKNLLGHPVTNFAFYIFNDGYGYLDSERYFVYDNPGRQYLVEEGPIEESHRMAAKAYIQKLYMEYNAKK